jgi:phosphatidylinositol-4,5-bisphosphate 3-kinase
MHDPMLMERFGLLQEEYLKGLRAPDFARINRESKMLSVLIDLAARVKAHDRRNTESAAERQTEFLRAELRRLGKAPAEESGLPPTFTLPLDPTFEACGLLAEKCKVMGSAQRPLWLEFQNADPHGDPLALILKTGDDLRQDILTLQMLKIIDQIWKAEGLNLWLVPYRCVATGEEQGMLEVVPGNTLLQIMREGSGTTSRGFITSTTWLSNWLRAQNPSPEAYEEAKERFLLSNAGYCVVQHVLGIGDRHPSNIMVKPNGNLFHIDFGHFLGHFKYAVKSIGVLRCPTMFLSSILFLAFVASAVNLTKAVRLSWQGDIPTVYRRSC